MAKPPYEIAVLRFLVSKSLPQLLEYRGLREPPEEFWRRVERAGLLVAALDKFDKLVAMYTGHTRVRRETKKQFAERVEREGRQAEAEQLRAKLSACGLSQRQVQVQLVRRLQPLDGTKTEAWETPDPWLAGRLFRRKAAQQRLLRLARKKTQTGHQYTQEEEDEDDGDEVVAALKQVNQAKERRRERRALAEAREHASISKMYADG